MIRHGQTNWNAERRVQGQSESTLDVVGREQAEALRPVVESLGINSVYSSTSVRTRQTTAILAGNLMVPVTFLDSLREIYLGPWESQLWGELEVSEKEQSTLFHSQPHKFDLPGAETFHQLQQRGVAAIEEIIARETADNVLIVSHGALIKATLVHYGGLELARMWEHPPIPNCAHSILRAAPDGQHQLVTIAGISFDDTGW